MLSGKLTPITLILLSLITAACSLAPAAGPAVSEEATQADVPVIPVTASTDTPAPTTTPLPSATPDLSVTITASTGSLGIRRGPGTAYNLLGYLTDGQSAVATARTTSGDWLYIPMPSAPGYFGWVSAVTVYSTITGDIDSLPVMSVAAAEPITIRNCTFHPMLITPIGVTLKPQFDSPANMVSVIPGDYVAYDQSTGNTQVKSMSLEEGDFVDIVTDGLSNTYACP